MNQTRLTLALFACTAAAAAAHASSYTAIDLGGLSGGAYFSTVATALNDAGQVTGTSYSSTAAASRAFLTGPNGSGMVDLGTLGGNSSRGNGINNYGQVVGAAARENGGIYPFLTGPNGTAMVGIDASNPWLGRGSEAFDVNDAGTVVGSYVTDNYSAPPRVFMTARGGDDTIMAWGIGAAFHSVANAVNNEGVVVGLGDASRGGVGPYYVLVGGPDPLGAWQTPWRELGGDRQARDLSDTGLMVGEIWEVGSSGWHAFISDIDGVTDWSALAWTDLGTLGGSYSRAHGVNNAGQVVGDSLTVDGESHAFAWGLEGTGMVDLNSLVDLPGNAWLYEALDINSSGQIIANGTNGHAYLITRQEASAVPDNATNTLALLLLGLLLCRRVAQVPSGRR